MSCFHDVAYVLKESDYLNIKETLDSESLEFLSFANRSQTVSALINVNSDIGFSIPEEEEK